MKKYNVFYKEDGRGPSLSESVLYDTDALSSAVTEMNTAFNEVSEVFKDMAQDSFFSEASWECEAADKARENYDKINGYCNTITNSYNGYTSFLQDAVDNDFKDIGTKIVSAINGESE